MLKCSLSSKKSKWPILEKLVELGSLSYIDFALTERLLRDFPQVSESSAAFICFLSLTSRNGHLSIKVDKDGICPEIKNLLKTDLEHVLKCSEHEDEQLEAFANLVKEGSSQIPPSLLELIKENQNPLCPLKPICQLGTGFYLQRHWYYETLFLIHVERILNSIPAIPIDLDIATKCAQSLLENGKLLQEQTNAILNACSNCLSIICGGPGTGKTYTAGQLIRIYWETMDPTYRSHCEIALAAPTGKAASNLQKSLRKGIGNVPGFPEVSAKTLHALLGIKESGERRKGFDKKLSADFILVDESSMIDAKLMGLLFESIKEGARIILLGDKYQLPPVGAGSLFSDLVAAREINGKSNDLAIELKTCMRTDLKGIIDLAKATNEGNVPLMLSLLKHSQTAGISSASFDEDKTIDELQQSIVGQVKSHFSYHLKPEEDFGQLFEIFNKFRILTPLRKGPFGYEQLNELCYRALIKNVPRNVWFASPIMIVNTDYRLGLFNGEMGILIRKNNGDTGRNGFLEEDYALFPNLSEENGNALMKKMPALVLPKFEYAYCLSVHKSQGSEFEHVLLLMPEGVEVFGREVLYTGVTRAKKRLELWGSESVIEKTLKQPSLRHSGVQARLKIMMNNYCKNPIGSQ